jgi:hypothetical protein
MMPLFMPPKRIVPTLRLRGATTIAELCEAAGVACRASGAWTQREIALERADEPAVEVEPGSWGRVRVGVPPAHARTARERARFALAVLAYALMDTVARESIRGCEWARPGQRGRPATGGLSNRQRQAAFRARKRARAAGESTHGP